MSTEKIIDHPIIGEYKIVKRLQSRGIRLSVHGTKGVKITIPTFASYKQASEFLESKIDWVSKSLERQKEKAKQQTLLLKDGASIILINGTINFSQSISLQPSTSEQTNLKITIKTNRHSQEGTISRSILYPANSSTEQIMEAIILAIKRSAQEYLPERTQHLANKYGFKYNKLFLKNNKSNWGSCSSLNNINLNIHLMRLPADLCDYVILHELAHLKHRNHSKKFHDYLNSLCNNREKEFSKELRKFRTFIQFKKADES